MKTSRKIYLYLEGELTPEERISFEKELADSPELQKELKLYQNFISYVEETKNVRLQSNYFDNIVPEFRKRLEGKNKVFTENRLCRSGFYYIISHCLFLI